jgi:NOL1/NOP2/sun family putative RNA methylase
VHPNLHKLPADFLAKMKAILPPARAPRLLDTFTSLKPTTFRVNTLVADHETITRELRALGIQYTRLNWYTDAYVLKDRRKTKALANSEIYSKGQIYLQSFSSMLPPLFLAPKPDDRVLDMCAAPGSKTTQMAAMMKNQGSILAIEKSRIRYDKLLANLSTQNAKLVIPQLGDSLHVCDTKREHFDKVLVDAPCTNEALINTIYPRTHRRWRQKNVVSMSRLQSKLLSAGFRALKPGGELVYSTCTYAPEENERVITGLLREFPDSANALPLGRKLPNFSPALRRYQGEDYSRQLQHARRVLPTAEMHGFFLCLIGKH